MVKLTCFTSCRSRNQLRSLFLTEVMHREHKYPNASYKLLYIKKLCSWCFFNLAVNFYLFSMHCIILKKGPSIPLSSRGRWCYYTVSIRKHFRESLVTAFKLHLLSLFLLTVLLQRLLVTVSPVSCRQSGKFDGNKPSFSLIVLSRPL